MSILITGAGGQVGRELVLRGGPHGVVGLDHRALDIRDRNAVAASIRSNSARILINAAAYTAVDKAESESDAAYAINRDGSAALADACAESGIPLLHLSTDFVFDGHKTGAYSESDPTGPIGVYGASKCAGEAAIRERHNAHLILRVSWVFGAHGNNFVRTMMRLGAERGELRVVDDQYGGPTHAGAIADTLLALANRHLVGEIFNWGTYHYTGGPVISWHGFAETIFREAYAVGMLPRLPLVHRITTAEYPTPARRPANSALDCSRIRTQLGMSPVEWLAGLRETLHSWKAE